MKTIYVKMNDPIEILPAVFISSETVKKYCVKVYRYDTELQALNAYAEIPCMYSTLLEEDADVESFVNEAVNHYLEGKIEDYDWLEANFT